MLSKFLRGFKLSFSGFSLITKKRIRPFVVVPFLINIAVFSIAIWVVFRIFEPLLGSFLAWLPAWLEWIQWLIWPVVGLSVLIIVLFSFTLLANLIAAPFNALLSERVEALLDGRPVPKFQGYKTVPSLLRRTLLSETRKIGYQFKWLIALILLSILPVLNLIAPLAWVYFAAWMLSISYGEYPMSNHELFFSDVKARLKADRAAAFGLGCGLMLFTMIPGVNFLAMPVGVASGTAFWVKRLDGNNVKLSQIESPI